ncbi:MAG: DUF1919 domain-containing protein [Paludibacter sp.]|nr:DUF1919 domain-containing protein [Paludibacter sp.]
MKSLKYIISKFKVVLAIALHFYIYLEVFIKHKMRRDVSEKEIGKLQNKDFVLISNNCFAGEAYQWLKLPYNTPFIGLFLYGPCYIKMLQNFDFYLKQDLVFVTKSTYLDTVQAYPIALLHDVELHFLHYKSEQEVVDKWYRRLERFNEQMTYDNLFFQISDRDLVDQNSIEAFHKLDFKNKLSFAAFDIESLNNQQHVNVYKQYNQHKGCTPNGKKLFEISFLYIDFVKWVNTRTITRTRFKD